MIEYFSEMEVIEILRLSNDGFSDSVIASRFGVLRQTVGKIRIQRA